MAKKQRKKNAPTKVWKFYEAGSELKRSGRFCPKCGAGVFMAKHKDRVTCGRCGYTEFLKSTD